MLEAPALFALAATLLGVEAERVVTTSFKWLRAVAPGEFTGVHADVVYVGGGTHNILTVWIPMGARLKHLLPTLLRSHGRPRCPHSQRAGSRSHRLPRPLAGDVPVELGGLLVCHGSHRLRSYAALREGYFASRIQADGTHSGWIADDGSRLDELLPQGAKADWCGRTTALSFCGLVLWAVFFSGRRVGFKRN